MFKPQERKAVFSLALILAFRMLGLFIIIPVFSPYLQGLNHSTPLLIGLTMGIYGLTQAIFQIPFGILSDYIGRKEVITAGLLIFLLGSLIAAISDNIYVTMLGRALQGAGAISGTTIALLSDLTTIESRTKAMAIIGVSIGSAFMLAFILGPVLNAVLSVNNMFYITALMVLPILYMLWYIVPDLPHNKSKNKTHHKPSLKALSQQWQSQGSENKKIFKQLKIHSFGIFSLHGLLMANFLAIPIIFKNFGLTSQAQGYAYIIIFLIAVVCMGPLLMIAERNKRQNEIIIFAVILLVLAQITFWLFNAKFWGIMVGLVLFFTGFNILEASLPSLISKIAPAENKGAVMGAYSTAQFLGPMLGGAVAGVLFKYYGLVAIFVFGLLWASLWLINLLSGYKFKKINFKNYYKL